MIGKKDKGEKSRDIQSGRLIKIRFVARCSLDGEEQRKITRNLGKGAHKIRVRRSRLLNEKVSCRANRMHRDNFEKKNRAPKGKLRIGEGG